MHDSWHARATLEKHYKLAAYFSRKFKELPSFHIRDMAMPDAEDDEPMDESTARGFEAWLQSRACTYMRHMREAKKEPICFAFRPPSIPVGYVAIDPFGEGRLYMLVKGGS
eukprot:1490982-Karenia_brevis.AAC.1